jgi:hypothetical protein
MQRGAKLGPAKSRGISIVPIARSLLPGAGEAIIVSRDAIGIDVANFAADAIIYLPRIEAAFAGRIAATPH